MARQTHAKTLIEGIVSALSETEKQSDIAPRVAYALEKMSEKAKEETTARVESSVALSENERASITRIIEELVGHPVELECSVHPELISGLRIKVGDWVLDTSYQDTLRRMAEMLVPAH